MKVPTRRSIQEEALASENLLELVPVRVAIWQEVEGRVVVERPRPRTRGLSGVGERVSHILIPDPRSAYSGYAYVVAC